MNRRKRLGDMLIELNYITEGDLEEALKIQKQTGDKIGEILNNKGFITEDDLLEVINALTYHAKEVVESGAKKSRAAFKVKMK